MSGVDVDVCFQVALPLVRRAGEVILQGFQSPNKKVKSKSFADDLLTETDQKVEELLIAELKKHFPTHKFIGEEGSGGAVAQYEASTEDPTWIIDPVDGTTNFVHGYPQVCVSVALWAASRPQLAFVFNPVLDQLFTAKRGQGAFLNGNKLSVSKTTQLENSIVGGDILSYQNQSARLEVSVANVKAVKSTARAFRIPGSVAISLAYVAMGALDAYFEQGPKSWDFAAGVLLVAEAGGVVRNLKGENFDLFGRNILVAATDALVMQIAPLLQTFPFGREERGVEAL